MKKNQFSATQIASILKELDGGKSAEEISRERGVSKATLLIGVKSTVAWKLVR
ncbi:transposase [Arachidicoccus terrestris]|uniref:transposase n=1 Tax=Arachidicoccus terrestris TaxID=2875539 RepID=UPI0037437997